MGRYKQEIRRLINAVNIKWVFDLHGASLNSPTLGNDMGTRKEHKSFNPETLGILKSTLTKRLGKTDFISDNKFPAYATKNQMSVTAFCHEELDVDAIQIEMKPFLRIPSRRIDSSAFLNGEHYQGDEKMVISMLQCLAEIIDYLHSNLSAHKK